MVINPIVGVYIPIIKIRGGMTIPNIATFDHRTYVTSGYFFLGGMKATPVGLLPGSLTQPLKIDCPKGKVVFQPSFFSGAMLNFEAGYFEDPKTPLLFRFKP